MSRGLEKFPTPDHELSDNEIERLYGRYMETTIQAFCRCDDLSYLIDFADRANNILRRREGVRTSAGERRT